MKVVKHWTDIEATPVDMEGVKNAVKRLVLGPADGTPQMALRVFTLAPGGYTPYHQHPFEHMNVVLEGRGMLRQADGERPMALAPGAMALVAPDEMHQFKNTGDTDFSFVCLVPNSYAYGTIAGS
jgi:quercetin dioxygenase-like cupin family protein